MKQPECGDGPRTDVPASSGAAAQTVGTVRPDEGRPQSSNETSTAVADRQAAWSRLWDRLLEAPDRPAA